MDKERSFETVFVDLEGAATAADAVAEIVVQAGSANGVWTRLKEGLASLMPGIRDAVDELGVAELRVKLRATLDPGSWRQKGDAVFAALAANERPVVLALDELPMLVNRLLKGPKHEMTPEGRASADEFLSWLRRNGQMYPGRVSMIVSGSVSLEPILREAGLTAQANIYAPLELKPWDEETAVACLGALADGAGVVVSKPVRREMCRLLRCQVPHHVQMFFDCVDEHLRRAGRRRASMDDVKRVYVAELLGVRGQMDLDHYETRLKIVVGTGRLSSCAGSPHRSCGAGGVASPRRNRTIRQVFRRAPSGQGPPAGLIRASARGTGARRISGEGRGTATDSFRGLLEDWWRARHGSGHVPIGERPV